MIEHSGSNYTAFIAWLRTPFSALMMVLLLIALFRHAALGLQVIVEDYVHSAAKIPTLIIVRLSCFVLVAAGRLSTMTMSWPTADVLRVAFSGS
jgi:succinate dehydrogenase / fumarate reductase membrane anchor subunit